MGQFSSRLRSRVERPLPISSYGKKARPDFTVIDGETGQIKKIVDAKTGNAQLTKNQKELFSNGGTLTGKNAKDFKGVEASGSTATEVRTVDVK